eukprot:765625-Hanusia_phi.AAC.1
MWGGSSGWGGDLAVAGGSMDGWMGERERKGKGDAFMHHNIDPALHPFSSSSLSSLPHANRGRQMLHSNLPSSAENAVNTGVGEGILNWITSRNLPGNVSKESALHLESLSHIPSRSSGEKQPQKELNELSRSQLAWPAEEKQIAAQKYGEESAKINILSSAGRVQNWAETLQNGIQSSLLSKPGLEQSFASPAEKKNGNSMMDKLKPNLHEKTSKVGTGLKQSCSLEKERGQPSGMQDWSVDPLLGEPNDCVEKASSVKLMQGAIHNPFGTEHRGLLEEGSHGKVPYNSCITSARTTNPQVRNGNSLKDDLMAAHAAASMHKTLGPNPVSLHLFVHPSMKQGRSPITNMNLGQNFLLNSMGERGMTEKQGYVEPQFLDTSGASASHISLQNNSALEKDINLKKSSNPVKKILDDGKLVNTSCGFPNAKTTYASTVLAGSDAKRGVRPPPLNSKVGEVSKGNSNRKDFEIPRSFPRLKELRSSLSCPEPVDCFDGPASSYIQALKSHSGANSLRDSNREAVRVQIARVDAPTGNLNHGSTPKGNEVEGSTTNEAWSTRTTAVLGTDRDKNLNDRIHETQSSSKPSQLQKPASIAKSRGQRENEPSRVPHISKGPAEGCSLEQEKSVTDNQNTKSASKQMENSSVGSQKACQSNDADKTKENCSVDVIAKPGEEKDRAPSGISSSKGSRQNVRMKNSNQEGNKQGESSIRSKADPSKEKDVLSPRSGKVANVRVLETTDTAKDSDGKLEDLEADKDKNLGGTRRDSVHSSVQDVIVPRTRNPPQRLSFEEVQDKRAIDLPESTAIAVRRKPNSDATTPNSPGVKTAKISVKPPTRNMNVDFVRLKDQSSLHLYDSLPLKRAMLNDDEEFRWVGRPIAESKRGKCYRGIIWDDTYFEEGCYVHLYAGGGESYIARAERLWERKDDKMPMLTCRWFYRPSDLPASLREKWALGLNKGVSKKNKAFPEVFISNTIDENPIASVQGLCEILISSDSDESKSFMQNDEVVVYTCCKRYDPQASLLNPLTEKDLRHGKRAAVASSRSHSFTKAYSKLGYWQRVSFLPTVSSNDSDDDDDDDDDAVENDVKVKITFKLGGKDGISESIRGCALLNKHWRSILEGSVYDRIVVKGLKESRRSAPKVESKSKKRETADPKDPDDSSSVDTESRPKKKAKVLQDSMEDKKSSKNSKPANEYSDVKDAKGSPKPAKAGKPKDASKGNEGTEVMSRVENGLPVNSNEEDDGSARSQRDSKKKKATSSGVLDVPIPRASARARFLAWLTVYQVVALWLEMSTGLKLMRCRWSKYDRQSRTFSPASLHSYREDFESTTESAELAMTLLKNATTLQASQPIVSFSRSLAFPSDSLCLSCHWVLLTVFTSTFLTSVVLTSGLRCGLTCPRHQLLTALCTSDCSCPKPATCVTPRHKRLPAMLLLRSRRATWDRAAGALGRSASAARQQDNVAGTGTEEENGRPQCS